MNAWMRAGAVCCLAISTILPAHAQERTAVRQGFSLPRNSGKTILVFRPAVSVGAQSTGGLFEPRADWTETAKKNIDISLVGFQSKLGNKVVFAPEGYGESGQLIDEYTKLFAAVSQSVITYQFFPGNRLPTKKWDNKAGVFDWSLGQDIAKLPGAADADYALFIYYKDAYGSTGRKLLQIAAALGPGLSVKSGEHAGYAGLVDLKTGDLVWLNADGAMGGDVRTADGAVKRMGQLLEDFPGSIDPAAAKKP